MNVHIQTLHFDADRRLIDYVNSKLEKLNTFHDRKADFFLKSTSKSFETYFDEAFEAVINQLKRKKQKQAA